MKITLLGRRLGVAAAIGLCGMTAFNALAGKPPPSTMSCQATVIYGDNNTGTMTWNCPAGTKCCVLHDSVGDPYGACGPLDQPCS